MNVNVSICLHNQDVGFPDAFTPWAGFHYKIIIASLQTSHQHVVRFLACKIKPAFRLESILDALHSVLDALP